MDTNQSYTALKFCENTVNAIQRDLAERFRLPPQSVSEIVFMSSAENKDTHKLAEVSFTLAFRDAAKMLTHRFYVAVDVKDQDNANPLYCVDISVQENEDSLYKQDIKAADNCGYESLTKSCVDALLKYDKHCKRNVQCSAASVVPFSAVVLPRNILREEPAY